jgi:hypothetical protein
MGNDKGWRTPIESRLAKAVEMDEVGPEFGFETREDALRIGNVVSFRILPFEREFGLEQADSAVAEHGALI